MTTKPKLTYVSLEPERQGHASYTHVHEIINGLVDFGRDKAYVLKNGGSQ